MCVILCPSLCREYLVQEAADKKQMVYDTSGWECITHKVHTPLVDVLTFTAVNVALEHSGTRERIGLWSIHVHGKIGIIIIMTCNLVYVCVNSTLDIWQGTNHSILVR